MADVVPRPAPRTSSPHTFETTQLLRRFPDTHRRLRPSDSAEILTLAIPPSDPDFIYPLDALRLELIIPTQYRRATDTPTSIIVLNSDIPPPWKRRIARWWKEAGGERTLLEKVKRLDRELEALLSAEGDGEGVVLEMRYRSAPKSAAPAAPRAPTPPPPVVEKPVEVKPAPKVVTPTQRAEAAKKRTREVRQLTTRLSREKGFAQLSPTTFTVPVNAQRRHLLPVPLQPVETVRLTVPLDYDIVPARIEVLGVPREVAQVVEVMWDSYVAGHPEVNLTAAVNVLGAKLHVWAFEEREPAPAVVEEELEPEVEAEPEKDTPPAIEGKPHIQVIARPPEWAPRATDDDGESSSDDSDYDSSSSGDEEEEGEEGSPAAAEGSGGSKAEHGTALSVPGIVLNNIDLLEPANLNLTLRCTRCKGEHEVQNLRGTPAGARPTPRAWRCEKCSAVLGIGFRKELVHIGSTRLGFFDLTNCTIAQLQPSDFIPQCGSCMTDVAAPELKGILRGQEVFTNCRNCHAKMSVMVPEFKLLRITHEGTGAALNVPLRKRKDEQRYIAGTELPNKGRCRHYRKSTRWFRFSCCSKIYPCDKCHDAKETHPLEHANRMVCGCCSREQNYRPDDCRYCGNGFVKKSLSRHWEGGKGTRDRRLMSKNDSRKYKRLGKPLE